MPENEQIQNFITELRRGSLTLAILGCLTERRYGYDLLQTLEKRGIDIEANTLYPMLRRLETQGLLLSRWDTTESRPRKYYTLSEQGRELQVRLKDEWRRMVVEMENLLLEDKFDE